MNFLYDDQHKLRPVPRTIAGWIGLLVVAAALVGASAIAGAVASQSPNHDDCSALKSDAATAAATGAAAPTLETGEVAQVKFGRRSGSKSDSVLLDNPGKSVPTVEVANTFVRSDGSAHFPSSDITAVVNAEDTAAAPTLLQLTVCANRSAAGADPGSYSGDVILSTGQATTRVPVSLTLSDTHAQTLVTVLFSLVLLFGTAYTWALEKAITADQNVLGLKAVERYLTWLTTLGGLISVAAGLAAAITVFNAQYLAADVWGSSAKEYFSLFGAVFVSFVGAATVSRVPGMHSTATPTVTALFPTAGPAAGGTPVTVGGTGFAGAIGVAFGTAAVENIDVQSDTVIKLVAPPHAAGAVDVTVTTVGGTSPAIPADQYTYE